MSRARKGMDPDPDSELAAELRQGGAGREWVEEAAEDERLTELLRRRKLELRDVLEDLAHKGARVSVDIEGHSFSGIVVGSGDDYASVEGGGQIADVRLDAATWSVGVPDQFAEGRLDTPATFRELLHEYAAGEARVRLLLGGGNELAGSIAVVAVDHVEFDDIDGRRTHIPVRLIVSVIRSSETH